MNRDDVIDVLTAIQSVDRRTVGDSDVDAWMVIIGELPKDLCIRAVIGHFRECPGVWLEPGHIFQRVRAIRRDQLERLDIEDRADYYAAIEAKAIPEIEALAASKSVDAALKFQRPRINALRVRCPHPPCKAPEGRPCRGAGGVELRQAPNGAHPSRLEAAKALMGGGAQ